MIEKLCILLNKILAAITHNVPAVCDGFVARISKPLGLQGYKTVGDGWRGNVLSTWPSQPNPEPPFGGEAHTDLLNAVCPLHYIFFLKAFCTTYHAAVVHGRTMACINAIYFLILLSILNYSTMIFCKKTFGMFYFLLVIFY